MWVAIKNKPSCKHGVKYLLKIQEQDDFLIAGKALEMLWLASFQSYQAFRNKK